MSLRTIHIAFVVLCCGLAVFLAGYSMATLDGPSRWIWTLVSLGAGALVVLYGIRFARKTRDVS